MGDRCSLQITMRHKDLAAFGKAIGCSDDYDWWDELDEAQPGIVTVSVREANYGWLSDREKAGEAGFAFFGQHDAGGTYGPSAFAAVNGEHMEVSVDYDGNLVLALDDDLNPLTGIEELKAFRAHRQAAEQAIGLHTAEGGEHADRSEEDRDTSLHRAA